MLAACDLSDLSHPEAYEAEQRPQRDSYAPTESLRPTGRLVFPGPRMQLRTRIVTPDRKYLLRGIFVVQMSYLDDGSVFATHTNLPVHGSGSDQSAALLAFCEAFDFQWRNLVDVPEDQLTAGGQRRRLEMQAAVEKVEEISAS